MALAYRRQSDCLVVALDREDQEMVTLTQHNETLAIEAPRTLLPTSAKMYEGLITAWFKHNQSKRWEIVH